MIRRLENFVMPHIEGLPGPKRVRFVPAEVLPMLDVPTQVGALYAPAELSPRHVFTDSRHQPSAGSQLENGQPASYPSRQPV